jgi:hypothetical protein
MHLIDTRTNKPCVAPERTGYRDLGLSERHRYWGFNVPALDIDFLFLEYDKGKAVALVEYKHEKAQLQYPNHPSYRALIDLGTKANVPVFACRYSDDFSKWIVIPLNANAIAILPERETMTEREWVCFLYHIRGYEAPEGLFVNDGVVI